MGGGPGSEVTYGDSGIIVGGGKVLFSSEGCEAERDMFGILWEHAAIGETVCQPCGADFIGKFAELLNLAA